MQWRWGAAWFPVVGPLQRPVGGQPRIAKPRRGVKVAFCTDTQRPMPGQCWGPRDCAPLTKPVLVISEFIWRTDLTIANGDISSQETSINYRYRTLWEEKEQNSQKIRDWGSIQLFSDQNKRLSSPAFISTSWWTSSCCWWNMGSR